MIQKDAPNPVNKRINFFLFIVLAALFILLGRLFFLQIIKGKIYEEKARENMLLQVEIKAPRGIIYDRFGRVLVKNRPSFDVYLIPDQMLNYVKTMDKISKILNIDKKNVYKLIKENKDDKSRMVKIKTDINKKQLYALEERKDDLPGVYIYIEPNREYVYKNIGSHLLGFVGELNEDEYKKLKDKGYKLRDTIGKQGLEKHYENYLRGRDGAQVMQVDSMGKVVKHLGRVDPVPGGNLFLNIDLDLQKCAYKSVLNKINYLNSIGVRDTACGVICLNARTGEVLAFLSYPDFDPNMFVKGMTQKQYNELILNKFYPLLNRTVSTAFPCASTFKIITSTAALQESIAREDSIFYCPGNYRVGEIVFNCFQRSGHGSINFLDAIAYSCDVVFYKLGEKLGLDRMLKYAGGYGFGKLTDIDIDEEIKGTLPSEAWKEKTIGEPWYPGDTVNLSIGQGFLQATPVQVAHMTQILADDGRPYKPFIVKKITSGAGGEIIKEFYPIEEEMPVPVKKDYYKTIKTGMGRVTEKGTAAGLDIKEFKIAGKTGTVENAVTASNPYARNHAWFTCFAPYGKDKEPEIVVTVFFEQSGGFGGSIAAPVAYDVVKCYYEKYHKKKKTDDR